MRLWWYCQFWTRSTGSTQSASLSQCYSLVKKQLILIYNLWFDPIKSMIYHTWGAKALNPWYTTLEEPRHQTHDIPHLRSQGIKPMIYHTWGAKALNPWYTTLEEPRHQTHDIPHLRRACWPIHQQGGFTIIIRQKFYSKINRDWGVRVCCLMPFSTIFQLYCGGQLVKTRVPR
jgi:hypothetical protein